MRTGLLVAVLLLAVAPVLAIGASLFDAPAGTWELLFSARVGRLTLATAGLGLGTAAAAALVGLPVAFALHRRRDLLARLTSSLLPLPLILPPWMAGLALAGSVRLSGWGGAVALLGAALWPIVTLFALRGLSAAAAAGESARLLAGARAARRSVEWPLALPSTAAGLALVFIFAVTDFGVVDFLSFNVPEPFTVLSSEIFAKWQRMGSAVDAAAVSLPALALGLAALAALLWAERRHAGLARGNPVRVPAARAPGPAGRLSLALLLAVMLAPLVVLAMWAARAPAALDVLSGSADEALASAGAAAGAGLAIALLGTALARLSLRLGPRAEALLLALALLPLAAPGVLYAVGVLRLWHLPGNPFDETLYRSPALLMAALAGRSLSLGVLAARALLARADPSPFEAGRLSGRAAPLRWAAVDLPLLAPALGLSFALGYLLSLRDLDLVTLLPAGNATLLHQIYALVHISSDALTALLCLLLAALALLPAAAALLLGVAAPRAGGR